MDAQKATEIARQYLKPFASFQPISAKKEDDYWVVRVVIGLFDKKVIQLEIDNQGEIVRGR